MSLRSLVFAKKKQHEWAKLWLPKLLPKNIEKLKVEYRIDNPHSFIFLKAPEDDLFSSNLKQNGTMLKSSAVDLNIIPSWVSWSGKKYQLKDKPIIKIGEFYYCLLEGDYYIWR